MTVVGTRRWKTLSSVTAGITGFPGSLWSWSLGDVSTQRSCSIPEGACNTGEWGHLFLRATIPSHPRNSDQNLFKDIKGRKNFYKIFLFFSWFEVLINFILFVLLDTKWHGFEKAGSKWITSAITKADLLLSWLAVPIPVLMLGSAQHMLRLVAERRTERPGAIQTRVRNPRGMREGVRSVSVIIYTRQLIWAHAKSPNTRKY